MADAPNLNENDTLKAAFPKINAAINNANEAKKAVVDVDAAVISANDAASRASTAATETETRLTELNGVDAVQFKDRQDSFDVQLSQTPKKDEVRLKTVKLELEDMSETTLGAMSGNASFNLLSIPQDGSVIPEKTTFLNSAKQLKNYFNKSTIIAGGYYDSTTGAWATSTTASSTDFISAEVGDVFSFKAVVGGGYHVTFWDANKVFINGVYLTISAGQTKTATAPANAKYMKTAVKNTELDQFLITKNSEMEYSYIELQENISIEKPLQKTNVAEFLNEGAISPKKTSFLQVTNERQVNYFDKTKVTGGGYYAGSTGSWTASTTASSSDFIPVIDGDTLRFQSIVGSGYHITFWDENKTYLSGENFSLSAGQVVTKTVPAGSRFFRTAYKDTEKDQFMVVKNISYPNRYYAFDELDYDLSMNEKMNQAVLDITSDSNQNKLYGLKWGVIGDSISTIGYKGDNMEYPKQIADRNNIALNNLAVPGSMITKTNISGHTTDHMCERVLELDADCDVVTVAGGVNDKRNNIPLGVMGDTVNTTFYGALDVLCNNLITRFHSKPKALITPIKYRANNESLKPYVNAIKEVAAKYAIPVLDSFNTGDLQPDIDFINNTYFYQGDGLHPNGAGHTIRAREVENFLKNLV